MKIGFIGAGNVAQTYARHFVRHGHEAVLSNSKGPDSLAELSPGPIDTPALGKTGLTPEQVKQVAAQWASEIPLARRGHPEEIAAAVVFLASEESSYITGVDLAVDGGMAQV